MQNHIKCVNFDDKSTYVLVGFPPGATVHPKCIFDVLFYDFLSFLDD